jgi:hypothetical protein
MMTCNTGLAVNFSQSTLFSKLLGFRAGQALTAVTAPAIAYRTASDPARIDKTRAVSFHCPSLASGTYSTAGQMGGSQLAKGQQLFVLLRYAMLCFCVLSSKQPIRIGSLVVA